MQEIIFVFANFKQNLKIILKLSFFNLRVILDYERRLIIFHIGLLITGICPRDEKKVEKIFTLPEAAIQDEIVDEAIEVRLR
jgi:hypothetical protein